MKLLMSYEQYQLVKQDLKDANTKVVSRPIKGLSNKCYDVTFPALTGGTEQLKREKELRNKLQQYIW